MQQILSFCLSTVILFSSAVFADTLAVGGSLPPLTIDDRGALVLDGDDIAFTPWDSSSIKDSVHVVQYFGATISDSEIFKSLTDTLEKNFKPGAVTVTTIINVDAALWGTAGLVISEVKKNKTRHPEAIIVLDEEGLGVDTWSLGKKGAALVIVDSSGVIRFLKTKKLSEEELAQALALLQTQVGS